MSGASSNGQDALSQVLDLAPGGGGGAAPMTDSEFAAASALVGQLTGIVIKSHKREMMQSRLARRLRALKIATYSDYLKYVASPEGAGEIGEMINAVTTNLTSMFRESHHFDHLREVVLDPMAAAGAPRIRIWSAACSSGEEPYSIAMTVMGSKADGHSNLKILATDLDTNMLSRGREGVYPADRFDPAPATLRDRASTPVDADKRRFADSVRKMITFNQLNLLHDWPVRGPFDAIFCRNVLIYFETPVKRRIVDRLAGLLRPGGALYLGHSESLLGDHPSLISEGRTIYMRRS